MILLALLMVIKINDMMKLESANGVPNPTPRSTPALSSININITAYETSYTYIHLTIH